MAAIRDMEYVCKHSYRASDLSTVEQCLADVRSCEIYVGIFAGRYGTCPEGFGGKSVTELEYREAVRTGKQRFVFIRPIECCDAKDTDGAMRRYELAEKLNTFVEELKRGEGHTPVFFDSELDLALKITQALSVENKVARCGRTFGGDAFAEVSSLGSDPGQADPAPDSGTELQRMLADRLNTSWSELAVLPEFCGSVVFSGLPKPLTPRGVFEACCGAPVPVDFLCELGWMVSDKEKTHSILRLLRENHVYRDTVKLMTLVGGEAFVIRGGHEVTLNKYEPLDGDDPRIVAVLAAACMGFGLKLSPGLPEPVNFLRLPVEEFGHRQGVELAEAEIAATVRRKLHLKAAQLQFSSGTGLTEGSSSKSVVKARLRTLLNELKFRLVIVAPDGSPMRDEDRARTVLEDFNVPTLFKGVPRAAVRDLMTDLSSLIAPLLDGTLSAPDQGTAANDA